MIFNSVTYILFLVLIIVLYWSLPRRPRLWLIFLGSLAFYGFWRFEFIPVMLASVITDYVAARSIHRTHDRRRRRLFLYLSLIVNLGLLGYFKYLIFFTENFVAAGQWLGFDLASPALAIMLPLGISFYTFQSISYTVDVYRGHIRPEQNFILFGCYVMFFPQLIAGPILRASEVIWQLSARPAFSLADIEAGLKRILAGLFLKVVLADNLAPMVDSGFSVPVDLLTALDVWTLAFLFGFQIYFDFSAYSHIAIGSARLMGIRFPENFDFPYLAVSPRDFWRRWHISLSSWIRDYLYLPLSGLVVEDRSTGGLTRATEGPRGARRAKAIFFTWLLMGLWHGANWTFVLWGLWHAVAITVYRGLAPLGKSIPTLLCTVGGWAATLAMAMLSWIPFRAENLGDALYMWGLVVTPSAYAHLGLRENNYLVAAIVLALVLAAWYAHTYFLPWLKRYRVAGIAIETVALALVIALVFVYLRPINQFIYFQF